MDTKTRPESPAADPPPTERFRARAEKLGVAVHFATTAQAVGERAVEIFRQAGAGSVALADELGVWGEPLRAALQAGGIELVESADPLVVARAVGGLSRAELAVAETGSVVVATNSLQSRLPGMLSVVHVALVETDRIVASLDDVGAYLASALRPDDRRYVTIVSGPSRTADVEKTLTVGVHGPGQLQVILVGAGDPSADRG